MVRLSRAQAEAVTGEIFIPNSTTDPVDHTDSDLSCMAPAPSDPTSRECNLSYSI